MRCASSSFLCTYIAYSDIDVYPNYTAIVGGDKAKGIWIPPAQHLIQGHMKQFADIAAVESMRIPGYWIDKGGFDTPAGAPPHPGEKVLLVFHGGVYSRLSAHPDDPQAATPRGILQHTQSVRRAFSPEYRVTRVKNPRNPFPTQLIDAIAAYAYLVNEVGFAPEDIVVEGESAGGHLVLGLVRYLIEQRGDGNTTIPRPPSAVILTSPWADMGVRGHGPDSSLYTNIESDFLNPIGPDFILATLQFLGPLGWSAADTNRYISPASESPLMEKVSFEGFPPTFIVVGGAETFRDMCRVLYRKMVKDMGEGKVEYLESPDAMHAFIGLPFVEPERSQALAQIGKWIDAV